MLSLQNRAFSSLSPVPVQRLGSKRLDSLLRTSSSSMLLLFFIAIALPPRDEVDSNAIKFKITTRVACGVRPSDLHFMHALQNVLLWSVHTAGMAEREVEAPFATTTSRPRLPAGHAQEMP